jgi:hypothetical protein
LDPHSDRQTFRRNVVAARAVAFAAALAFAVFVTLKGVPTLRHDWNWPIDTATIPSFVEDSFSGWLPVGFGIPNAHPTAYIIALPLVAAMWLLGPLAALVLFAFVAGYLCVRGGAALAARWTAAPAASAGIGMFAIFNPWVYNEVVAGHLVMVLSYGALLGFIAEVLRGRDASSVRLALWLALIEAQLQFFIIAMLALIVFAAVTKKWLPLAAGAVFILPSAIGVAAERGLLLQTPYGLTWQSNQSVEPAALLGLGGYFPGYADRLGTFASIAAWLVLALAALGAFFTRRSRATIAAAVAAVAIFLIVSGVHGPLAFAYEWTVRSIPESGVFRELYDLTGIFAALLALLAARAAARGPLQYVALAAGIILPITWIVHPPSDFWVGAGTYPHPVPSAPPFLRVALLPAFQPLQLRTGEGDGADPDAHVYPRRVAVINQYFPTFPVDMALARYERTGDAAALQALGVGEIIARPWLESRSNGTVGLAARSLSAASGPLAVPPQQFIVGPAPLVSECVGSRVVAFVNRLGACNVFFADAPGYAPIRPIVASSDSIDPGTAWIDARLAFAGVPEAAQAIGGALTQSRVPFPVTADEWLLTFVRGRLLTDGGMTLAAGPGAFAWIPIPVGVAAVRCDGLCELVAQSRAIPAGARETTARVRALEFHSPVPWLYFVSREFGNAAVLRLNERYDPGWIGFSSWHLLPHVKVDMCVNGWLVSGRPGGLVLVQITALLQAIAEIIGVVCLLLLLKALQRAPTKRAS